MPWNPNVPTVTNRVQDDLDAIRENFQVLAGVRIVEMGSNANGTYVRWENGLQVCWHRLNATVDITVSIGTVWRSGHSNPELIWVLPASFTGTPITLAKLLSGDTNFDVWVQGDRPISPYQYQLLASRSLTGVVVSLDVFAIGRWK